MILALAAAEESTKIAMDGPAKEPVDEKNTA